MPSPGCAESVHYPVFNPEDPRHNPAAADYPLIRKCETQQTRGSLRWVQSLPRRSLRKAKSGLFALTAGMQRHPGSRKGIGPGACTSPNREELPIQRKRTPLSTSTTSVASTTADAEFGVGLYRIKCNCSTFRLHDREYMVAISSSSSLTLISPLRLSEVNYRVSRYGGSKPPGDLSKSPPKRPTLRWYHDYDEQSQKTETSARTVSDSTLGDSLKENVPQITDFKLDTEPLCLFPAPSLESMGHSSALLLDHEDEDNKVKDCSSSSTKSFSIAVDGPAKSDSQSEQGAGNFQEANPHVGLADVSIVIGPVFKAPNVL